MGNPVDRMYYPAMVQTPLGQHAAVSQILTGHFREVTGYRATRPTGAGDWLLILTVGGAGRFGHIGGETVTAPGDLVLIRPHTMHDYAVAATADRWDLLWAHFQPRDHWFGYLDWPELSTGTMLLRGVGAAIEKQFVRMDRLFHAPRRLREDFAMNALETLLLQCEALNPRADGAALDGRVAAAMDFLDRNLSRPIVVDDVAAAVALSSSRMAHLFRSETGRTIQSYLEAQRMQRAVELLTRTGFSVQQIAAAVGFDSAFYFSRRFKLWTGLSPSTWRDRVVRHGGG